MLNKAIKNIRKWPARSARRPTCRPPRWVFMDFLKIISVGIPTYAGVKTGF